MATESQADILFHGLHVIRPDITEAAVINSLGHPEQWYVRKADSCPVHSSTVASYVDHCKARQYHAKRDAFLADRGAAAK